MDVVEFVEREFDIELLEYQKRFLQGLADLGPDRCVVLTSSRDGVYMYQWYNLLKELISNGSTNDSKY